MRHHANALRKDFSTMKHFMFFTRILALAALSVAVVQAQRLPLAQGVKQVCVLNFDKDPKHPAKVEDSALACLDQAAGLLQAAPNQKLVIVGTSHPLFDHEEKDHGMERDVEDESGEDIRFEDVAAYRAVNTKAYFTRWYGIKPERIIPTTDEYSLGQKAILYLVPANANFTHNYLKTTATNENPCTVKPCYLQKEDSLLAQNRDKIKAKGSK
jgi:hypothetical protein